MKIQLKNSSVLDSGSAKQPTAANMLDGELAVNFNSNDPAIFIKDSNGTIIRLAGKDNVSFTNYQAVIPSAATPPSGAGVGNLYFDTDEERLFYYYNDGNTVQWVDASKEKFDTNVIPDITNTGQQSGTLDDRYVNLNGDTLTGNLVLNAGLTVNTSNIYLNNGNITFEGSTANAFETTLQVENPTADNSVVIPNVSGTIVTTGDTGSITSTMIANGAITDADINASAGITLSKLGTGFLPSGIQIDSANIASGSIVDADINNSAAISLTKLADGALPSGVTITSSNIAGGLSPNDIAAGALPSNVTVSSSNIVNGAILNADINASAEIEVSKLADGSSYQLLQTNAAGTGVEWTSNVDVPGTLDVTGISTFDSNVSIAGNLIVSGSAISLDSPIVTIKDSNIQLGTVSSPSNATADGGGLTLKGSTDKTLRWLNSGNAWTSSENLDLASGKEYRINGNQVLTQTSLGTNVTGSSLTSVGTITSGTWQGSPIDNAYLATITTSGKVANSATTATSVNSTNAIVSRDGSGDFVARNITASLLGNASTASALQTARTISLTGDLSGSASFDGSSNITINTTASFVGTTNLSYNNSTRVIASDTGTNATLPIFSSTIPGLTPLSGGGTANYLRADGTWAAPPGTATNLGYVSATSTVTSSTGSGVALPVFTSAINGLVPYSGGGTTKFLRADGSWITLGSRQTFIGTSAPSSPNSGDQWFDTDEGRTYIYYVDSDSAQWVEGNPSWNGGIPVGSIVPSYLSTGGPYWDASGNLELTSAGTGVILRSPNGTRYKITVSNSGVLSTSAV